MSMALARLFGTLGTEAQGFGAAITKSAADRLERERQARMDHLAENADQRQNTLATLQVMQAYPELSMGGDTPPAGGAPAAAPDALQAATAGMGAGTLLPGLQPLSAAARTPAPTGGGDALQEAARTLGGSLPGLPPLAASVRAPGASGSAAEGGGGTSANPSPSAAPSSGRRIQIRVGDQTLSIDPTRSAAVVGEERADTRAAATRHRLFEAAKADAIARHATPEQAEAFGHVVEEGIASGRWSEEPATMAQQMDFERQKLQIATDQHLREIEATGRNQLRVAQVGAGATRYAADRAAQGRASSPTHARYADARAAQAAAMNVMRLPEVGGDARKAIQVVINNPSPMGPAADEQVRAELEKMLLPAEGRTRRTPAQILNGTP